MQNKYAKEAKKERKYETREQWEKGESYPYLLPHRRALQEQW